MTNDELIRIVVSALPHPAQITDWDTRTEGSIRFTWRGNRFRVSDTLFTESVKGEFLCRDDLACLLETLLKKVAYA